MHCDFSAFIPKARWQGIWAAVMLTALTTGNAAAQDEVVLRCVLDSPQFGKTSPVVWFKFPMNNYWNESANGIDWGVRPCSSDDPVETINCIATSTTYTYEIFTPEFLLLRATINRIDGTIRVTGTRSRGGGSGTCEKVDPPSAPPVRF